MTSLSTGAGGREYQLDFIGRDAQEDYTDEMRYQSLATDTDIERLDGMTEAISVGLLRFSTAAGFRGLVTISGASAEGSMIPDRVVGADEVEDLGIFGFSGSTRITTLMVSLAQVREPVQQCHSISDITNVETLLQHEYQFTR